MGKGIIEFEKRTVDTDNGLQRVIILRNGENLLEMARFIAEGNMYHNGLEKNYKKLVDMDELAKALVVLLNSRIHANFGDVTEIIWKGSTEPFTKFIERRRTVWSHVEDFIKGDGYYE